MPNQMGQWVSAGHVLVAQDEVVTLVRTENSADGWYWEEVLDFTPVVKVWRGWERRQESSALTVCSNL